MDNVRYYFLFDHSSIDNGKGICMVTLTASAVSLLTKADAMISVAVVFFFFRLTLMALVFLD